MYTRYPCPRGRYIIMYTRYPCPRGRYIIMYTRYPCQRARYVLLEDGWVNNTTYCGGKDSVCITGIYLTTIK